MIIKDPLFRVCGLYLPLTHLLFKVKDLTDRRVGIFFFSHFNMKEVSLSTRIVFYESKYFNLFSCDVLTFTIILFEKKKRGSGWIKIEYDSFFLFLRRL